LEKGEFFPLLQFSCRVQSTLTSFYFLFYSFYFFLLLFSLKCHGNLNSSLSLSLYPSFIFFHFLLYSTATSILSFSLSNSSSFSLLFYFLFIPKVLIACSRTRIQVKGGWMGGDSDKCNLCPFPYCRFVLLQENPHRLENRFLLNLNLNISLSSFT